MVTDVAPATASVATDMRTLGRRIRAARSGRGMTQEAFAAELGIARETLSDLELGKRRNVRAVTVRGLQGYGISMAEFMEAALVESDVD